MLTGQEKIKASTSQEAKFSSFLIPTFFLALTLLISGCSEQASTSSTLVDVSSEPLEVPGLQFYRQNGAKRLIIFVHGFMGNARETWIHERTQAYWPELMAEDAAFSDSDVAVYGYESSLFEQSFSVDEIADNLRLRLEAAKIPRKYKEVVFLTHSMGGLVVRAFALKFRDLVKIPAIYFFATPTNGADLGNLASLVPGSKQADGLKTLQENQVLQLQSSQWLASKQHKEIRSYCAYETKTTKGLLVVPRQSATSLCNQRLDPISENHIRIVKPSSTHSDAYVAFKVAYEETFERLQLIDGRPDITIDSPDFQFPGSNSILTADNLRISTNYTAPNDALIVANSIEFGEDGVLNGKNLSIVTASTAGGTVNVTGKPGNNGGQLLIAAGRIIGTRILASGGNGLKGQNGRDGSAGSNGGNGRSGSCKGFGGWRTAHAGGNGTDGTDGTNGGGGGNGGNGGAVYLIALNQPGVQPDVNGGAAGVGGEGGRAGRGGKGGKGGRGCTGLGGSQENAIDGSDGSDGRSGQRGAPGNPGTVGAVWIKLVDSLTEIAKHIPGADEIQDYKQDIIRNLQAAARSQ